MHHKEGGDSCSRFIHKGKEVGPQSTIGVGTHVQGDGFASEPGGIMEVAAMWLSTLSLVKLWSSLGPMPNYVVLVLGNEGRGPYMQSRHTHDVWIGFMKLVVLTLNIHQIFSRG